MSAICTRHDKTTLLVTKGDNGHFRTLRTITYKKILNQSNAILAACLHLLATFGLEFRAFACKKKNTMCKKVGGRCPPPCPSPSAAYEIVSRKNGAIQLQRCNYSPTMVQCKSIGAIEQTIICNTAQRTKKNICHET